MVQELHQQENPPTLELRNSNSHSLIIAMADTDAHIPLDTSLLRRGFSIAVQL
jgi:hypothetical protein